MSKMKAVSASRSRLWLGGFCLLVFAAISAAMRQGWTDPIDTVIREAIQSRDAPGLLRFAIGITNGGELVLQLLLFVPAAIYLRLYTGRWRPPMLLLANLGGVWILNTALKDLYRRDRPTIRHLVEAGGYSFPSGHAMSSAAFYGMIGYLLWKAYRRSWQGAWLFPALAALLVLIIGWSRVYLGVHFPSDVLAGYAAGGFWLLLCLARYDRMSEPAG